jgi:beta-phosphoglucomutase-like phosphatase (HAD superfamily)
VLAAAQELGVAPEQCVLVGDIAADLEAARAAGARSVLVPTQATRAEEVWRAEEVAADLAAAADRVVLGDSP